MAGLTVYSTLPPLVQAYYDKRFLLRAKENLAAYQFAQKRSLPKAKGKTVYFTRYTPLNKQTSALTETVDGGISVATRQQLNIEETAATVALWGDFVTISALASVTSIDPEVSEKADILGQQAGESMDYYTMKTLATGIRRRRADGDSNYQVEATADSGTTTTLVDASLTQADDYWNGGFITITAGTNYGETRKVTDFANATGTVTFAAMPKANDSTSQYRLVVGTGIVAGDVLTTGNIRLANRDMKRAKSLKYEKGYNIVLVDPDIEYDFMGDTTWVDAAVYKDKVDSLYEGEIGKWFGNRFVGTTQLYRESVAGGEQDGSGAVHIACMLGKECYGVVELEGQAKKIYIRTPEQLGQPIPLYGSCGWQAGFEAKVLNGMYGIGIMCGASA